MERRTNAASDQTKYALAVALKELMAFAGTVLQEQILGARLHWAEEIEKQ